MTLPLLTPFLAGRRVALGSRSVEPITAPWDGARLGEVALGTGADLDEALAVARDPAASPARLTRVERARILASMADRILSLETELAETIARDAGKPITLARGEVQRCVTVFRLAAAEATRLGASAVPAEGDPRGAGYRASIERFPIGPIAAISPFNFPLNLVAHKVAPAFAAGNPVILKPAPQAPMAAFRLAELFAEAGAPAGTLQVLHLPIAVAERFATDPGFAMLSFTGSDRVGWHLKSIAGRKRVTLELGGNAGTIVHSDTRDLDAAAARNVWGAFAYAGQVCVKVQRLFIHRPVYARFRDQVVAATNALPVGDPFDPKTVAGPMIDDDAATRVGSWVDEARAAGATVLVPGSRSGRLLGPVVLEDVDRKLSVSCREVFGPVLTLAPYDDFGEAIRMVNDSEFGLQAGVYTRDDARIDQAFREIEVGGVVVNDIPTVRFDHLPYGGVKASGFGREGVRSAMKEMTEERVLLVKTTA